MNYLNYWQLTCLTFNLAAAPWQGIPAEGSRYIPPMPQVLGFARRRHRATWPSGKCGLRSRLRGIGSFRIAGTLSKPLFYLDEAKHVHTWTAAAPFGTCQCRCRVQVSRQVLPA